MPKTRPPCSPEFRRQMVELVRAVRDPADLAREFEPTSQSICHWVTQADRQEGRREEKGDGLAAAERDELARLRRENEQLRLERDILFRAAACRSPAFTLGGSDRRRRTRGRHGAAESGCGRSTPVRARHAVHRACMASFGQEGRTGASASRDGCARPVWWVPAVVEPA